MKTKEELNALKNEVETLNKKLAELSEEELTQVVGGLGDHEFEFGTEELRKRLGDAAEKEKQEVVPLSNKILENVSGGYSEGYPPDTPCPCCGTSLKSADRRTVSGKRVSVCPNCGEEWVYF